VVADAEHLHPALDEVARAATAELSATGAVAETVRTIADVRYVGQSHETSVVCPPGTSWPDLGRRFHEAHEERNGFSRPDDPIEVVTVRAEAVGRPTLRWADLPETRPRGEARRGDREVRIAAGSDTASVWWRPGLGVDVEVTGPAIIEDVESTTYLERGERARVHPSGALEVAW
jgi:N-methylhydantoinase A